MDDRVFVFGTCTRVCAVCGDAYEEPHGSEFTLVAACDGCSLAAPGRRSGTAGGERRDPVREEPPARKPSPMWHLNLCPEEWGCPNCTDRRDARWQWANGDHR
jgi:hypothetical protein